MLTWFVLLNWTAPVAEGGWDAVPPPQGVDIAATQVVPTGWDQPAQPPSGAHWEWFWTAELNFDAV